MKRLLSTFILLFFFAVAVNARGRVRVGWVDTSDPSAVRVVISAVDRKTLEPVNLSDFEYIRVDVTPMDDNLPAKTIEMENQASIGPDPGQFSLTKDLASPLYVVFVIAMHGRVPKEVVSAVKIALSKATKPLKKDAKVALILYGDRIKLLRNNNGSMYFMDVNADGKLLNGIRNHSITEKDCFTSPAGLKALKTTRLHPLGLFPRLWGIKENLIQEANSRGHYSIDFSISHKKQETFAMGAVEAAARLIMSFAQPGSERTVILLSDGRDGYLDAQTMFAQKASAQCRALKSIHAALQCLSKAIGEKAKPRYWARVKYLKYLIPLLQALNIRVFAVSYPQTPRLEEDLLRALALKTGGTFRSGRGWASKGFINLVAQSTTEIAQEAVITLKTPLKQGHWYNFSAVAQQKESKAEIESKRNYLAYIPVKRFILIRLFHRLQAYMISKVGNTWGPPLTWAVLVMALFMLIMIIKGIKAMIKAIKGVSKAKQLQKQSLAKLKGKRK